MNAHSPTVWASRFGRACIYLALALPFGVAVFTVLVVGLATGLGLAVMFWGIPVLMLTAAVCRWFGVLERGLTSRLLDATFRELPRPEAGLGWWEKLKWYASDRYTWTSMLYASLKFPFGVAAFTLLSIALATPLAFISAPFWAVGDEIQLAGWQLDSLAESLIAVPIGFLMLPISVVLILGMGWLMRVMAELLLDGSKRSSQAGGSTQMRTYPEPGSARLVDA